MKNVETDTKQSFPSAAAAKSLQYDPVRSRRRQPTRLPRPWDSPGKNTGVGCRFLLLCMHARLVASVAYDSVRRYGQQPTKLLCPRDSSGKNAGVGCHFLLQSFPSSSSLSD